MLSTENGTRLRFLDDEHLEAVWRMFSCLRLRGSRAKWLLHSPGSPATRVHLSAILQLRPLRLGYASIHPTASQTATPWWRVATAVRFKGFRSLPAIFCVYAVLHLERWEDGSSAVPEPIEKSKQVLRPSTLGFHYTRAREFPTPPSRKEPPGSGPDLGTERSEKIEKRV